MIEVFRNLDHLAALPSGRSVAIGTFDGVHLGHRRVIGSALDWGRAHDAPVAVVTFEPHPLEVLRPDDPPELLTPLAIKADLVAELGVDELVVIAFTEEFSRLGAEQFCHDVLIDRLNARHVSVGANFRFGHGATGDAAFLACQPGFETDVVPLAELDGAPVSSSRIRDLVRRGDVADARKLLGAAFQLEGAVVSGDQRGRSLGLPTANFVPEKDIAVPRDGVYAALAAAHRPEATDPRPAAQAALLPAAVNIGVRPTFESDGERMVEAYLIDFEGDLYGRRLRLAFLRWLRDELRFESADELVEQMRRDVEEVKRVVSVSEEAKP